MAQLSRSILLRKRVENGVHTPHVQTITGRIRFALFPVHSPLLGESRLLSFPPPNKMFQFGGFPYLAV